jgi:hypothetical protein
MDMEGVVRAKASPREAQFMRLREVIEACAKGNYQPTEFNGTPPKQSVHCTSIISIDDRQMFVKRRRFFLP